MAVTVGTGVTVKKVVVVGSTTSVKKVVVGTPVKRVTSGTFNINNITGVDTTGAVNGSLLIYNSNQLKWLASRDLTEQDINGGSY
jgi:hypothetical protein